MKILLASLVVSLAAAAAAAGQQGDALQDPSTAGTRPPSAGWSVTPTLLVSRTFDDNVLLHGPGDPLERDYINVINPRGEANYHGRLSDVSFTYDGAIILYNRLDTLNSYEQHGTMSVRRKLSKRNSFSMTGSLAAAPTTEMLQLSGVPYVRAGVFTDTFRAGIDSQVSKRLTITTGGYFDQAHFDVNEIYANVLLGGYGIGANVGARERLSERTSLTADFDVQHDSIGTATNEEFNIQHVLGGVEHQVTEHLRAFAGAGFSRLGETPFGPARIGPSYRLGVNEHFRSTLIDVSYERSYVPSFGFGGTTQNGNFTARVRLPITRRIYTQDLVSWQQQDPLVIAVPQLRSTWLQAAVGYAPHPALRIEAYFAGTRQTAGREDGQLLLHNQVGIQVIASKPVRIR
jgi:hypothetical protein